MVKIKCCHCGQKIGVPDKYIGKNVRCPKCKRPVKVPGSVEKTGSPAAPIIKFRCPHCSQKIGVTLEYAGKRVRCAKCKESIVVPQAPSQTEHYIVKDKPASIKAAQEQFSEDKLSFNGLDDIDELLLAEANAPSVARPTEKRTGTNSSDKNSTQGFQSPLPESGPFFGTSTMPEATRKKSPIIIIGIVFIFAMLLIGIIVLYTPENSDIYEGPLFVITDKNFKQGFIDDTGKTIIKTKFDVGGLIPQGFSDGLARVGIGDKCCYIDRKGKTQFFLDSKYHSASAFSEGLAAVGCIIGNQEKHGFIDKTGNLVIDTKFDLVNDFSEGAACVVINSQTGGFIDGIYGYIDKTGQYLVEPKFDYAEDFSEGLACVVVGGKKGGIFAEYGGKVGGKYGYIDKNGNYIIEPQFEWATSFSEGLAVVVIDRKAGFINKNGEVVIEAKFDSASPFSDGLACVKVNGLTGYIDNTGKFVIEPQFKMAAYSFSEGFAAVHDGSKFGFIDKTGKFIIEPRYELPGNFTNGLARINIGNSWGYIDKTGKLVWKSKY